MQEHIDSNNDPFENFCWMYDPHDECNNEHSNNNQNEVLGNCINVASVGGDNSIDNDAAEHICGIDQKCYIDYKLLQVIEKLTGMSTAML